MQSVRDNDGEVLERVAHAALKSARRQTARRLAHTAQILARACRISTKGYVMSNSDPNRTEQIRSVLIASRVQRIRTDLADAALEYCSVQHRLLLSVRQARRLLRRRRAHADAEQIVRGR